MRSKFAAYILLSFSACTVALLAGCKSSKTKSDSDGGSNLISRAEAKSKSINNLKQMALAMHNYASAYLDVFPSAGQKPGSKEKPEGFLSPFGWRVECLPFIEQNNLYQLAMEHRQDGLLPSSVTTTPVMTYIHPSSDNSKSLKTNYRVFVGNGAAFEYGKRISLSDFKDGLANTILIVEAAEPVDWWKVAELEYDPKKPLPKLGVIEGGFCAAMGDGSIRWIPSDTDEKLIRAMITRSGGEKITLPGRTY